MADDLTGSGLRPTSANRPGSLWRLIRSDIHANRRNWKGVFLLVLYRFAHAVVDAPAYLKPFGWFYIAFYKLLTELLIGTEIHWRCEIGEGARVYHGYGLVVHSDAKIGARVVLRHGATIGVKVTNGEALAPSIGDDVDIGAGAIILGGIRVGDGAVIGAGAVVTKDVPPRVVVAGNPARVIRTVS